MQLVVLAVATSWHRCCATIVSEPLMPICLSLIDYTQIELARVAEEITALPKDSVIMSCLTDFAVLRDQVRPCAGG